MKVYHPNPFLAPWTLPIRRKLSSKFGVHLVVPGFNLVLRALPPTSSVMRQHLIKGFNLGRALTLLEPNRDPFNPINNGFVERRALLLQGT